MLNKMISDLEVVILNIREQKEAAKKFVAFWSGRGYEKGESQQFWTALFRDVMGMEEPEKHMKFEVQVKIDKSTKFIDVLIPETHVMVEQKGSNIDLRKASKQSDGTLLTPYQQAKRYAGELPYSDRPRWIIVSNFKKFLIYDRQEPQMEPIAIKLEELPDKVGELGFLVKLTEKRIIEEKKLSIKAGEIVGRLRDAIANGQRWKKR